MTELYILSSVLAVAAAVLGILLARTKRSAVLLEIEKKTAEKTASDLLLQKQDAEQSLREKSEAVTVLTGQLARTEAQVEGLTQQGERDRKELEKLQASFRLEFRNLANEILDEKSTQFKKTNEEAMNILLKPFRNSITEFRERVEKIYSEENRQHGALKQEIHSLQELNRRITEETANLTSALKGNSKVQGDWGEMILETILQSSNLVCGVHYFPQENIKDEAGANLRPDVILRLPDNKQIVIDSKVSLTAFVNHAGAEDDATRRQSLDEHVRSVRKHVNELGSKRYHELLDSPDFVIMFVPNEPAFLAALQSDPAIWDEAYRRKVIISSPTNLFALLKIVDDLWKRDKQSRNAIEIADEGAKLYDKFVGFVETLESIGKGIGAAQAGYEKAMVQLSAGSGNLIGRTEKLRKLGVKASKSLPLKMVRDSEDGVHDAIGDTDDDMEVDK